MPTKKTISRFAASLAVAVLAVVATSCVNDFYFRYVEVASAGWQKDSVCTFTVDVPDSLTAYDLYIHVRNTPDYPYQNLWLFLNTLTPDSVAAADTIELYLADHRGQWLGSGAGSLRDVPVLYRQCLRFDRPGTYTYGIVHGMRTDTLPGIAEVGMRIVISE